MHGNAWMESGKVDSREVCGCFATDGCVKACHKVRQKYTLCKLSRLLFKHRECQPTQPEAQTKCHSNTHIHAEQQHCARLYRSLVFMLPYVFRLHGFFVLSKLNTQAIIHDAHREPVQQQGGCHLASGSVRMQGCCWAGWRWANFHHIFFFLKGEHSYWNDYDKDYKVVQWLSLSLHGKKAECWIHILEAFQCVAFSPCVWDCSSATTVQVCVYEGNWKS